MNARLPLCFSLFARKRSLALLLIALFYALVPLDCFGAPQGHLRVIYGFDREYAPFTYEEPGGDPIGFEWDIVKAIFAETEAKLVPRPMQWSMIPLELSSGTITLTTGMVSTPLRSRTYLFSDLPTFSLQIRLFTKVYNRFPSANLLRGQKVSVEQGSYQHRLLQEYGGFNIKPYNNRTDGLRALYNDEVAAFCGTVQNTYYYINKLNYGAITTVGTPLGTIELRVAVNRDRGDVLRMVNAGLARLRENGEYNRLYRKWFVRELSDNERKMMIESAKKAAIPAYAPYSKQGQGAAVLTATGKIYTGCTIENADLTLALSALRNAVGRTIGEGEFEIRAAVVVTPEGEVVPPAPEDLQTLYEFGFGVLAVLEPVKGTYVTSMMAELLTAPVEPLTPVVKIE